jgi:hypothetical protein
LFDVVIGHQQLFPKINKIMDEESIYSGDDNNNEDSQQEWGK